MNLVKIGAMATLAIQRFVRNAGLRLVARLRRVDPHSAFRHNPHFSVGCADVDISLHQITTVNEGLDGLVANDLIEVEADWPISPRVIPIRDRC